MTIIQLTGILLYHEKEQGGPTIFFRLKPVSNAQLNFLILKFFQYFLRLLLYKRSCHVYNGNHGILHIICIMHM